MSKYAIVQISGRQVKVSEGDKLTLDRLDQEEGQEFQNKEVLMISDDKTHQIGTPLLEKASVTFKVTENGRSKKIRVAKFRAKSKYRRVYGHRQPQSTIEVVKING
ncbi:MAG: 50S ribosomal protein L21 [Candidatus Pacebacteria bacterium]|jgi:large subunit ribosomal protein L21|nr:50S ribosomal protein L21 [Candidatus Paceibacterota bacterium]MBT3512067.1 50S ribosomal protein L21 [Candidatus Paceibacterota bacterium]MBT4004818.1 50S ribosomal protein L21 [Candidatus Paceibacterota bacterium]MBT4358475.1 50S ribosomal protein L21 [Candidatus Paceibacterota bacterium]MBT4681259.1 50S ribosomal protein L21 [Candidatus Paceibacterota bacterium]